MFDTQSLSSFGQMAEKLTFSVTTLAHIMLGACVVVGVFLIILAVGFYREHRNNPKFVPLDKVVMYFILGLLLFSVPVISYFFGPPGSPLELKRAKAVAAAVQHRDADAPIPAPLLPKNVDIDAPLQ